MKIKFLIAAISSAAVLMGIAVPATAQNISNIPYPSGQWVSVAGNKNDQTDVDVKTAQQHGNAVLFWERQTSIGFGISRGKTTLLYTEVYCGNHTFRYHKAVEFDSSGQLIRQIDTPSIWNNTVPGSIGEAVSQFACQ